MHCQIRNAAKHAILASFVFATCATGQGLLDDIQGGPPAQQLERDDRAYLEDCSIEYISRPLIAAAESGRLIRAPKVGETVTEGDIIAETDSTISMYQWRVKHKEYMAEVQKLDSDVEIRFAEAQEKVAEMSYRDAADANERVKNAVSPNQLREREFEWKAGKLRVEKTINDRKITASLAKVKLEEYRLAEAMVEMHKIKSPVTGIVEQPTTVNAPLKYVGEWVRPGDVIAQVTQLDKLRVVGLLDQKKCNRKLLKNKPVTIRIPIIGSEEVRTIQSKISYIGTTAEKVEGLIEVWAEIDNTDLDIVPGTFRVEMEFDLY